MLNYNIYSIHMYIYLYTYNIYIYIHVYIYIYINNLFIYIIITLHIYIYLSICPIISVKKVLAVQPLVQVAGRIFMSMMVEKSGRVQQGSNNTKDPSIVKRMGLMTWKISSSSSSYTREMRCLSEEKSNPMPPLELCFYVFFLFV